MSRGLSLTLVRKNLRVRTVECVEPPCWASMLGRAVLGRACEGRALLAACTLPHSSGRGGRGSEGRACCCRYVIAEVVNFLR